MRRVRFHWSPVPVTIRSARPFTTFFTLQLGYLVADAMHDVTVRRWCACSPPHPTGGELTVNDLLLATGVRADHGGAQ